MLRSTKKNAKGIILILHNNIHKHITQYANSKTKSEKLGENVSDSQKFSCLELGSTISQTDEVSTHTFSDYPSTENSEVLANTQSYCLMTSVLCRVLLTSERNQRYLTNTAILNRAEEFLSITADKRVLLIRETLHLRLTKPTEQS